MNNDLRIEAHYLSQYLSETIVPSLQEAGMVETAINIEVAARVMRKLLEANGED